MMENPIKMDDLGVLVPLFLETPISVAFAWYPEVSFFWGAHICKRFPKSPTNFGNLLDNFVHLMPPPGPRTF